MARSKLSIASFLLFSCLILAAKAQDDDIEDIEVVEEEKAFLIVRKNILNREKVVVGKPITVEIEVHNAGTRVPAGSTTKFSYDVNPLTAGFYSARPARVVYRAFPDAPERTVITSTTPHFHILSTFQKYIQAGLTTGSYISLGSLRTTSDWRNVAIVAFLLLSAIGGQAVYKNVTGARKKSVYQKNLEEVNKWK